MSAATFGTLSTLDTLASNFQTVAQYGEDRAFEDFQRLLDAHNGLVNEMLDSFVNRTTERLARYGAGAIMTMEQLDEFGSPHPQKVSVGSNVGFPLALYGNALQWNRKYFQNAKVAEFAGQITAMFTGDIGNVAIQIKKALFTGTNYSTSDPLVDNLGNTGLGSGVQLPVKALVNADGGEIPVGPNGETYDGSTHTHYLGAVTGGALVVADMNGVIDTVVEHFATGEPMVFINRADETNVRALTGFVGYTDVRVVGQTTAQQAPGKALYPTNVYNRAIGVYRGAEVWVKPWVPQWYIFCYLQGQPAPLMFRERTVGSGVLTLIAEQESHPIRARMYEREFGIGCWNRTNGAVLYYNSQSYVAPTISSVIG
jgi:hypothetical protein